MIIVASKLNWNAPETVMDPFDGGWYLAPRERGEISY